MEPYGEQRRHPRYQPQGRTLARVSSAPEYLFHVVDISCGGLAFRYLGDQALETWPTELELLLGEHSALSRLPVETVSDSTLDYGYIPMRRRGLKFGELTPGQQGELEQFIKQCTSRGMH